MDACCRSVRRGCLFLRLLLSVLGRRRQRHLLCADIMAVLSAVRDPLLRRVRFQRPGRGHKQHSFIVSSFLSKISCCLGRFLLNIGKRTDTDAFAADICALQMCCRPQQRFIPVQCILTGEFVEPLRGQRLYRTDLETQTATAASHIETLGFDGRFIRS